MKNEWAVAAVILDPQDNVATVLSHADKGQTVFFLDNTGMEHKVVSLEPIPKYFKIATRKIEGGASIMKFGQPIGQALVRIDEGAKVHIHNIRSLRAQADNA